MARGRDAEDVRSSSRRPRPRLSRGPASFDQPSYQGFFEQEVNCMTVIDVGSYLREGYHLLPALLDEGDVSRAVEFFDSMDAADEVPACYEAEYDTGAGMRRL